MNILEHVFWRTYVHTSIGQTPRSGLVRAQDANALSSGRGSGRGGGARNTDPCPSPWAGGLTHNLSDTAVSDQTIPGRPRPSCVPSLYSVDANSTPFPQVVTIKDTPDIAKLPNVPPGGKFPQLLQSPPALTTRAGPSY